MAQRIPTRTCIGCSKKRPKTELVRLVCRNMDTLTIDRRQRMPGRGCYICPDKSCLETSIKKNRFSRALRKKIKVDAQSLRKQLDDVT